MISSVGCMTAGIGSWNNRRDMISVNSGIAKNNPTANPNIIMPCTSGHCSTGTASGTSSRPTTGTIQAGVACTSSCRRCSQRLTTSQANSVIAVAPIAHTIRAAVRLSGASSIASSSMLIGTRPNRLPATGCWNSAFTAAKALTIFTP